MAAAYKTISFILNVIQIVFSVALAGVSIWFFTEIKSLTDLRNRDKYLIHFSASLPQILPWVFIVICVIVILVTVCGFHGLCSSKRSAWITYVTFLSAVTIAAFAAGIVGLVCADTESTDEFIADTVSNAFDQIKVRKEVTAAFGDIERRLRCCGVKGSFDYSDAVPDSCCDKDELVSCENSASRRHGCVEVAVPYARMFMKFTSIGSLVIAFVCTASIVIAVLLARNVKCKKDRLKTQAEKEPLKLPL